MERFSPGVRLTPREDILLTDLADRDRRNVEALLRDHGVLAADQWVPIKRNSFACPALPTCGTGCPNGCSRPYTAEIGLVGRGKKNYDIHLGGEPVGIRLNDVFAENIPRDELVNVLRLCWPTTVISAAVRRLLPPPGCRSAAGPPRHRALGTQAARTRPRRTPTQDDLCCGRRDDRVTGVNCARLFRE